MPTARLTAWNLGAGTNILREPALKRLYLLCHLPFTVVAEAIVAGESDKPSEANTKEEEKDLRGSVDPHLKEGNRKYEKLLCWYRG